MEILWSDGCKVMRFDGVRAECLCTGSDPVDAWNIVCRLGEERGCHLSLLPHGLARELLACWINSKRRAKNENPAS